MAFTEAEGWMPGVEYHPSPNHFATNNGLHNLKAAVMHVVEGSYQSCIGTFVNERRASANFCVAKDGRIAQFVSILKGAWGNGISYVGGGLWLNPYGHRFVPPWSGHGLSVPQNPNFYTVSVEHEGFTGEPWTQAMFDSTVKILQWLTKMTGLTWRPMPDPRASLIGHCHIDPIDKGRCPGPTVDFAKLAQAANGQPETAHPGGAFTIVGAAGANIRQGPATRFAVGRILPADTVCAFDKLVTGGDCEVVNGIGAWGHLQSGEGFVWTGNVERVLTYVVDDPTGANIRQAASAQAPLWNGPLPLATGTAVTFDDIVPGEELGGLAWWGHLADERGFIHLSTVQAQPKPTV